MRVSLNVVEDEHFPISRWQGREQMFQVEAINRNLWATMLWHLPAAFLLLGYWLNRSTLPDVFTATIYSDPEQPCSQGRSPGEARQRNDGPDPDLLNQIWHLWVRADEPPHKGVHRRRVLTVDLAKRRLIPRLQETPQESLLVSIVAHRCGAGTTIISASGRTGFTK
jgi:hypothetical protein